jgi:hypothetical protein
MLKAGPNYYAVLALQLYVRDGSVLIQIVAHYNIHQILPSSACLIGSIYTHKPAVPL